MTKAALGALLTLVMLHACTEAVSGALRGLQGVW